MTSQVLPFHLVGGLGDEEALGVGGDLGSPWVDRDLAVLAVLALDLYGEQQQLQLGEAQPAGHASSLQLHIV